MSKPIIEVKGISKRYQLGSISEPAGGEVAESELLVAE